MKKKKEEEDKVQKQLEKDIEWGDHNDKFTRWSNWKMMNFKKQMLLGFKQLLQSKKLILRMIPSSLSQSVEDEVR